MLSYTDTHLHQEKQRKQPDIDPSVHPNPHPSSSDQNQNQNLNRFSPSETPHSDSGRSMSSSSSGEITRPTRSSVHSATLNVYLIPSQPQIMSTPFDLGSQRFEYPFPQTQGSPIEQYLPLSSSITSHSHAQLTQLPPWPIHISKSFPLTQPPLGRGKAHPKLRSASVREPPVPPGLVKRRSRVAGLQRQSSEELSDKSDTSDEILRTLRPPHFSQSLAGALPRASIHSVDLEQSMSEMVPVKQVSSLPIGAFDRPGIEGPAGLTVDSGQSEGTPRPSVVSSSAYDT